MEKSFSTSFIGITITGIGPTKTSEGYISLRYNSKYAGGESRGFTKDQIPQIIKEIENLCGKGSYCLYEGKGEKYPKAVDYFESRNLVFPKITYWQQGIKTDVIEQTRNAMQIAFGDIPETEIGWFENQCMSYIEDIK